MNDQDTITDRILKFCSWRERCSFEVEKKLVELGADKKKIEKIIHWLKEENFVNDQRFATSYARGKLNNNQWGRIKITMGLRALKLDNEFINDALNHLDEESYHETLRKLARKKQSTIKAGSKYEMKQKLFAYLAAKGFEQNLIVEIVNEQLTE